MTRITLSSLAALAFIAVPFTLQAQSGSPTEQLPPKTWVDKDTGHRVWRISDEPNSGAYYFNVNAYTPDHKQMVYNSPQGIRVLDLATMQTKMLVPNPPANADSSRIGAEHEPSSSATKPTASSSPASTPTPTPTPSTKPTPTPATSASSSTSPAASASSASTPMKPSPPAPTTKPTSPEAIPTPPTPSSTILRPRPRRPTETPQQTSAEPTSRPTTKAR